MAASTLRSFQNEIDELQKQGLAKKRLVPASDKENKDPTTVIVPSSPVIEEKHVQEDDLVDEADLQVRALTSSVRCVDHSPSSTGSVYYCLRRKQTANVQRTYSLDYSRVIRANTL